MSQNEQILRWLHAYGMITPQMAMHEFGCMRLAARISDLRRQGYSIRTEIKHRGPTKWAEYRLAS